jgi:hypothetical protein
LKKIAVWVLASVAAIALAVVAAEPGGLGTNGCVTVHVPCGPDPEG